MKYECLSKAVGESVRESVAFRDSSENEYDKDLNLYFMHTNNPSTDSEAVCAKNTVRCVPVSFR